MKGKRVKHMRRKVTSEQVDAMNRELLLRSATYAYRIDLDGRLTKVQVTCYHDYDVCVRNAE